MSRSGRRRGSAPVAKVGFLLHSVFGRTAILVATLLAVCLTANADTTSSISSNFNGTAIAGGNTIWFSSVLKPSGLGKSPVTIFVRKSTVTFTANNKNYSIAGPDANVIFSPSATNATINFSASLNQWQLTVPSSGLAGNTFLDAVEFPVPTGGLPGGIKNVTWQMNFSTDTSGISLQWQWAAAVYSSLSTNYSSVGVKPVDDNKASQYKNSDAAGTPENYKAYVIGGATGGGGSNYTGGYSGTVSLKPTVVQAPTAKSGGPYSGMVGQANSFNGSGSTDPDGYPLTYSWTFGDTGTGTGATPTHTYATAGSYTVTLSVTDGRNATGTATTTATITASGPTITSFSPPSGAVGTPVSVTGTNFTANGQNPQVTLNQQGGGTIAAPISSATATSLSFVIPSGAATGPITVSVNGQSATSATSLTVVAASSFGLAAGPSSVTLLPGQTATVQVSLTSTNGFSQLAALSVAGLPSGVTARFQPPQITAGQFSILTLSAPASQNASTSSLTISASATVQGIPEIQTAGISLNVQALSGSATFAGQVAVTDAYDTPLAGVTVSFTGKNYTGAHTGCSGSTTTDGGGNFVLNGLSNSCTGAQMIQYDPSTVVSPPGKYSGVTLSYVLTPGQVTTPGIVVHLPNVTNGETFSISQNSSTDQTFTSKTIPGVSITIYAGTIFTLADGTQPNPFPLSVVEIPYDKIPDYMPPNPTQDPVFAMSIEPFNSSSSQPVAITYPNRKNTPPGTDMPLTSLNPTMGMMVNYGTGSVSADGTQIVPDADPATPGHLYGISHFDWHFPLPGPGPGPGPGGGGGGGGGGPGGGDPVDVATGILTLSKPDAAIGGARGPIAIVRSYQEMSSGPGPFGIGTNHNYNWLLDMTYISSVQGSSSQVTLVRPDGNRFPFAGQAGGVYTSTTIPSLAGATLTTSQCFANVYSYRCSGTLTWKNGTVYQFQPLLAGEAIGFLTSITDANGNATQIVHDSYIPIEVAQVIDPVGRSLSLSYDGSYRVTSITDPIGRTVLYTYNGNGKLATVKDLGGGTTTYNYNGQNQLASIIDARGITFLQNTYDPNGRVIQQVAADGGVTTFSYVQLNPAVPTSPLDHTAVTDPNGNVTTYHFNPAGFPLDVTDASGKSVYDIDPGTNMNRSITDPLMRTTAFTYDSSGNTLTVTRLANTSKAVTTTYTYEPVHNKLASVMDALGDTVTLKYDNNGNLISKTSPVNQATTYYAYDSYGEPASVTDPLGNTTHYSYVNGALASITDPAGNTATRVSDAVARLTSVTNPLGQTTAYQYDNQDKIATVTNAMGGVTSFTYDGNGNLLTVQDARQQGTTNKTVYTYDSMDRISTRTDPLGRQESYTYDQNGNILAVTDRRGIVSKFQYDRLNRRYFMGFGANGSSYQSTITNSYDAGSRLLSVVDSSSGTITPQFDGLNNLVSETTPLGSISYGYDGAGRRISSTVSGQPGATYTYDNANRLTKITQGMSVTTFTYDNDNRRMSMTLPSGIVANYGYDTDSRLTSITYQLGSTIIGNLLYTYDSVGHRTQIAGTLVNTALPAAVTSATYDTANELTNWNGVNISYDANGSVINDGAASYSWNARGQLAGRGSVTYQYDAYGRRVRNAAGNSLFYDGKDVTQEQAGGVPVANRSTGGVDEFFSRSDTTGTYTPLTDAMGSVFALANSAGSLVTRYTYDPFGNTSASGTASSNTFQYAGRENDGNGLYYYRARYYSPALHRFISQDPVGYAAGTNVYAYAFNNPVSFRDPGGKSPCVIGALGGVIVYNGYTVYSEISAAVNGRKGPNPGGWSGAWQILTGSANAALTGCAVADGVTALADVLGAGAEGASEVGAECGLCFPAGTPVWTRNGLVAIENLKIGDEVLSRNRKTGSLEYRKVTALVIPHLDKLLAVRIQGETGPLRATPLHPFFSKRGNFQEGWLKADELQVSDEVWTEKGNWARVEAVLPLEGQQTVYNFTVEDNHDYFVGTSGLLVHNAGPCGLRPRPDYVVTENGTAVEIPEGYEGRVADNGQGLVYQDPASVGVDNSNSIRIMDPNSQNPDGYVRIYNEYNQPVTLDGTPGPPSQTHIPTTGNGGPY